MRLTNKTLFNVKVLTDLRKTERPEWLTLRKLGIGGSESGASCGKSIYASPLTIYMDKKDMTPEREDNEFMEFGREAEDMIRDWFSRRLSKELKTDVEVSHYPWMMQDKKYPFMLANIDGLCRINGVIYGIEIKTAERSQKKHWDNDSIPVVYMYQIQHYMAVTGLKAFYVVCLLGKKLIWRKVERDEQIIAEIRESEGELWEMIQNGEMPAPIGIENEVKALNELGYTGQEMVISDDSVDTLIADRQSVKAHMKQLEADEYRLKAEILKAMNGHKLLITDKFKVNHIRSQTRGFDKARLMKEHREIYEQYETTYQKDGGIRIYS